MRPLLPLLLLAISCAGPNARMVKLDEQYASDTAVAARLLEPMGIEPPHGQLTVTMTARFAEKLLRASLEPGVLVLSVQAPGRVWKQETTKLGLAFDNGAWLDAGSVTLRLEPQGLSLAGDRVVLRSRVDGAGELAARLRLFGVPVERKVELAARYEDALQLALEHTDAGWFLHPVGDPLKVRVDVRVPAISLAGHDVLPASFAHEVAVPTEKLKAFALPPPAPKQLKIGANTMELALTNLALGTRDDRVWVGADLVAKIAEAPSASSTPEAKTPEKTEERETPAAPPVPRAPSG